MPIALACALIYIVLFTFYVGGLDAQKGAVCSLMTLYDEGSNASSTHTASDLHRTLVVEKLPILNRSGMLIGDPL